MEPQMNDEHGWNDEPTAVCRQAAVETQRRTTSEPRASATRLWVMCLLNLRSPAFIGGLSLVDSNLEQTA